MYRKLFISVILVISACSLLMAQTPETKKDNTDDSKSFTYYFNSDGAYLGVQTVEVNKDNFAKFGLREVRGVAIEKVIENSPAAAAGLQNGDVIVRFNGDEVTSTRKLTRLIGEVTPDHAVSITVIRGGREQEIRATMGKNPMPKWDNGNFSLNMPNMDNFKFDHNFDFKFDMPDLKGLEALKNLDHFQGFEKFKDFDLKLDKLNDLNLNLNLDHLKGLEKLKDLEHLKDMPEFKEFSYTLPDGDYQGFIWNGASRKIGVGVYPLTKQLGERYGVEGGLMVNEVRADSPASKAGLKAGDIIVEVNGRPVRYDFDLIRTVNETKGDLTVTFIRDKNRQTVTVTQ